jgi:hypothetical protein
VRTSRLEAALSQSEKRVTVRGLGVALRRTRMQWLGIGFGMLAVVWLWRRGMKPALNEVRSPARVVGALEFLLRRGLNGGTLRFQVDDDASRAVVFTKYIVAHGNVGCTGVCHQGAEPGARFDALRQDLVERAIPHTVVTTASGNGIEVTCERDLGLGVMLVVLAFQHLFQVNVGEHCIAVFEDVLSVDAPKFTGVDEGPRAS